MRTIRLHEVHERLVSTLESAKCKSLVNLIQVGLRDMDAGRDTDAAKQIRGITHQRYFDLTKFANSAGREHVWVFVLSDAAMVARDNAPSKICKYLSEEEAVHWILIAQGDVEDILATAAKMI